MHKKILFLTLGIIVFCGWATRQKKDIRKATWLIGTWENKKQRGSIYETWVKISDTELSGKSYILKNKDTIIFETVRLVKEQDNLFYIPTVNNQNNHLPVRFVLTTISDTVLIFENPQHDFPQRISYTRIGSDSLVAEISGVKNEQERKQAFPMKRMK